ncbi:MULTISPECIES: hypothetical protein [unclassified Kitasatospora]|uniref:hypothetical protein n=1 Tax=unclassified Kitasatospora TaxID=2633591 RepID=UPI00070CFC0A|nr:MULTISPECIES: hypothetical protein [unclassified Kitasatospora]KQV14639.1 hypothetical protein ASC99_31335 [Kitasatospora sp. Root107]KRB72454.1 hypothetical protein ASE03_23365 [Kitasatospora sp. Root187]
MDDWWVGVLMALSGNEASPSGVLLRLLGQEHQYVRQNVTRRRDLPVDVVEAILAHPDLKVRLNFGESERADPAQRARLLDDPSPRAVLMLAIGPTPYRGRVEPLPDWAYERLLAHPRELVRGETAVSGSVPEHVLAGLVSSPEAFLRRASCRAWGSLSDSAREALLRDEEPEVRQAAALRACPEDEGLTAQLVEELAGSWQLSDVLEHGRLGRELAERLVAEGERLSAVAANPSLPPDLVARLAVHPDPQVRLRISARAELGESERASIDYAVDPEARLGTLDWVWRAREDPDVLRRCATSAHPWLRRSAAVCPTLPPDLVERLAEDEDFAVRLLLCEFHPEPPPELLLDLYLGGGHRAARMLVVHERFPSAGLAARFADSADPERRRLALRDPEMEPEVLDRLSRDPETRGTAARHPRLPLARLRELIEASDTTVAAAGSPQLPAEDMHWLLDRAGVPALTAPV